MQKQENNSNPISTSIIIKRFFIVLSIITTSTFVIIAASSFLVLSIDGANGKLMKGPLLIVLLVSGLLLFLIFKVHRYLWFLVEKTKKSIAFALWVVAIIAFDLLIAVVLLGLKGSII